MKNVFHPWLVTNKTQLPVIVFVDDLESHINLPICEFCRANQIILVCIIPDAEKLVHPMEAIFLPYIQNLWLHPFIENDKFKVTNTSFPQMLKKVFEGLTVDQLKRGFRECGLYPFNSQAPYNRKVIKPGIKGTKSGIQVTKPDIQAAQPGVQPSVQAAKSTQVVISNQQSQIFRLQFERLLGPLLHEFKASGNTWKGAVENTSLFEFSKNLPKMVVCVNTNK